MKQFFFAAVFTLICTAAFAQNNFEGKVIYKMTSARQGNAVITITTLFGDQKIKAAVQSTGVQEEGMDDLIIDFKNGVIHYLHNDRKTYRTENIEQGRLQLMPSLMAAPVKNTRVLGYACSAYNATDTAATEGAKQKTFDFLYADSLYYSINKQFANLEMIPMFTSGTHVGMGMTYTETSRHGKQEIMTIIPQSVTAEKISEDEFSLAGFTKGEEFDNSTIMTDSAALPGSMTSLAADSAQKAVNNVGKREVKSKGTKAKKSPAKNTHTQPTKSPAIKPKQ